MMKIAAFNLKNLGGTNLRDETVVSNLVEIVSQYSVVVILEVRDESGQAMNGLLQELNSSGGNQSKPFSMTASPQLGHGDAHQEQFVCFYREADVTLSDSYQYSGNEVGTVDVFAREPYILHFSCPNAVVKNLVLIAVHTKPTDAEKELNHLCDVVEAVKRRWQREEMIILGSFNAGGRSLSPQQKRRTRIYRPPYYWLLQDDVDTTINNFNDNTYGRIVVHGQTMKDAIVLESAKVFNFQREFELTDEEALSISGHCPVEVELKTEEMVTKVKRTGTKRGRTKEERKCKEKKRKRKNKGPAGQEEGEKEDE